MNASMDQVNIFHSAFQIGQTTCFLGPQSRRLDQPVAVRRRRGRIFVAATPKNTLRESLIRAWQPAIFEHCRWVPLAILLRCHHPGESGSMRAQRRSMVILMLAHSSRHANGVPRATPRSRLTSCHRKHRAFMTFLQFRVAGIAVLSCRNIGTLNCYSAQPETMTPN